MPHAKRNGADRNSDRRARPSRAARRAVWALLWCIALPLWTIAAPVSAQTGERIGQVAQLTGPSIALRGDTAVSLYPGADIYRGDRLRTLEGAKLRIDFADGSELVLGDNSILAVSRYAPGAGEGLLELVAGIVRTALSRSTAWRRFDVRSQNAVASARSTEWIVTTSAGGDAVFVVTGQVAVSAAGSQVVLGEGEGTDIRPAAPPTAPVRWGQPRVTQVLSRTTIP
jgi:ferric-dicitrate binding protein FerR (iron transport regulator)